MATVDELVNTAVTRADEFAAAADSAIGSISVPIFTPNQPKSLNIGKSNFDAEFVQPAADNTPYPVYVDPAVALPANPTLVALHGITEPSLPTAPTISTAGLFQQQAPSSVMPDWNEANPALHTDAIYDDLKNLAAPILADVELPNITPLTLSATPVLQLPDYEAYPTPEAIPAATNYAEYMKARYDAALPEMQAFVDNIVTTWVNRFAPEYEEQRAKINAKLLAGMDGGVLPDQFEAAMYSRARARVETEYKAAESSILAQGEKRGFLIPPSATVSALNKARLEGAKSLAGQSTEVYIERRRAEVQHLQFVLNIASAQMQNVRALAVQYAQTGMSIIQQANGQAEALSQKLVTLFEHERSRREFSLAVMKAINEQYEVKLKAALSGLEGYKLELQALELRSNVELKQVEAAKSKIQAQQILVERYSAMIDAIAKRVTVDELRIKEYGIRADVFKTNIQARLATFEAYKASIDGDRAKLQGELAKLETYNQQLKSAEIKLEVQSKVLDADVKTNDARMEQYKGGLQAYRIASEVALQKFTSQAEIKKLGLDVYKTNIQANVAVYEGEIKKDLAAVQAEIDAYKANVSYLESYYRLMVANNELYLKKTTSIADGYTNMASATLQALGTTVSQTTSE
jgi:hypothetical protein